MTGVVEAHLQPANRGPRLREPTSELFDAREDFGTVGVKHEHHVVVGDPPELLEHPREFLRIRRRVAQPKTGGSTIVHADHQREAARLDRGLCRDEPGKEHPGERGNALPHGLAFTRTNELWSKSLGRANGSVRAAFPRAASLRAASSAMEARNGESLVIRKKRSNSGAASSS